MSITVLLAEDQRMVLGALGSLLGLEPDIDIIDTATDGDEALRLVQTLQPDILLTDIEMPRRQRPGRRRRGPPKRGWPPVVFILSHVRPQRMPVRRALDAGVSGCLREDTPLGHAGQRRAHRPPRRTPP